jgi:hypothetical protein
MFIEHIGEVFESVLGSDIVGESARTVKIDRQMGSEYAKFKVATGLATSIFFYSFPAIERRGISIQRLRVAFLREGIPPAIVGDALKKLEDIDGPLYLHFEKGLYYFSSQVGLNRIILDREEVIKEEEIKDEIRGRVEKIAGKDFEVYIWPRSNAGIPDNKKLKLVILPLELMMDDPNTHKFIQDILTNYSTGYRIYKNTLIFLVSDPNEYDGLKGCVRRFLALKIITSDKEVWKTLTEADKDRASQWFKDKDSDVWSRIISTYRYLIKGSKDGLEKFDLGILTIGERPSLSMRVKHYLRDQEVLLDKLSPRVLIEKTFSEKDERKNLVEVWEAFLKYCELPILENENVLKSTVIKGVQEGVFGLLINDKVWYKESIPPPEISEDVIIVRGEIAARMKEEVEEVKPGEELLPTKSEEVIVSPEVSKEALQRVIIEAEIPWDKLSDLIRGVFMPLNREGAKISLRMKIEASSERGISKDTLDLKVRETLRQIGAKIIEEKAE